MEHDNLRIEIEGLEADDIYADMIRLEVELDDDLACMFRLELAMPQNPDGTWKYIDEDRFSVWRRVTVGAGFESGMDELITGYTTHVKPLFDPDPSRCALEIWGMDNSVLLDREEKLKDWPNKKDSDIATEIFAGYGLTPDVEDTDIVHDEAVSTIIQRETDMRFLRRLAFRNGFEFFIEGTTGHFRPPLVSDPPQPLLAAHFGDETNLESFSIEVNALRSADVSMSLIDRTDKSVLEVSVSSGALASLGAGDAAALLPAGIDPAKLHVCMNGATGTPEMTALCQGLFDEYAWFVTGEGEIAGNKYGHVLKPRKTVTIKGVGETHSGVYYVTHVTHTFTSEGYTQSFRVRRNALMPTGSENFSAEGSSGGLF